MVLRAEDAKGADADEASENLPKSATEERPRGGVELPDQTCLHMFSPHFPWVHPMWVVSDMLEEFPRWRRSPSLSSGPRSPSSYALLD